MSRFPMPQDETKRREVMAIYREMGLEEGKVFSNFFTGMALRPDLLRGAWALTQSLHGGILPVRLRDLILTAVSAQNRSHYCCLSHAAQLKKHGVPMEQIESAMSDPALVAIPDPDRQVLLFAVKAAVTPNDLAVGDFQRLRGLGFSDEELLEVVMTAAFSNWSNTWSTAADIILD